jgi:hypothetical protein
MIHSAFAALFKRARLALLFGLFASGCNTVEFWEREAFADPVMDFAEDPTEVHIYQKVYYSGEGAAGGIGTSAGGGCGCY